MLSQTKKQILTLALLASIACPLTAMEPTNESSGWFGWKSAAAGAVLLVGGALYGYKYWKKTQRPCKTVYLQFDEKTKSEKASEELTDKKSRPKGPAGRRLPSGRAPKSEAVDQQPVNQSPTVNQSPKVSGINYGVTQSDLDSIKLRSVKK